MDDQSVRILGRFAASTPIRGRMGRMSRSFRSTSSSSPASSPSSRFDAVVVGAGFGGLGAALTFAERGARVCLLEQLNYPGGCASTFARAGYRFESGATLFSGFGPEQPFARWIARHRMPVEVDFIDPLVELRTPSFSLAVPRDRGAFLDRVRALPGAPVERLDRFFAYQRTVADALWGLLDDPSLLPPFDLRALLRHVRRLPAYLPLVSSVGRSLDAVLRRFGLESYRPLRTYLDALCQITVQCSSREVEAPFALGTMDYYFRGTGHVRGGIGALATAMVGAIERAGGEVRLASRAKRVEPGRGARWRVEARGGAVEAEHVVLNLIPQAAQRVLGEAFESRSLARRARAVASGWGAAMLYLVADAPPEVGPDAHHLELVPDEDRPFVEGHHLFCSISGEADEGRAGAGERTLTVSTHVPMRRLLALSEAERGAYVRTVQDRMRSGLAALAPEWWSRVKHDMSASPRTFARFTGRPHGYVGGIPRRRGLHHYLDLVPSPLRPGLHLVGDSVFPGQSTLATALGGLKVAERILGPALRRAALSARSVGLEREERAPS